MTKKNDQDQDNLPGFRHAGENLPALKPASSTQMRVINTAVEIESEKPENIVFQHSVLCQTCLPYRDPGDDIRVWDRYNGLVGLRVKAGEAMHPNGKFVDLGLPFGPKPRLILCYLNTQAIIRQTPVIEVQDTLTSFVKRIGLDTHGRNIRVIKEQLARIAAADLVLGSAAADRTRTTAPGKIVKEFDLWFSKNSESQRVFWPTTVTLGTDYFQSLMKHAVPLDERALAALAHSAMALDIYAWLAQRLHRVEPRKGGFVDWNSLHMQFGFGHTKLFKFRQVFKVALSQVLAVYPAAKLDLNSGGITLRNSSPPIQRRLFKV